MKGLVAFAIALFLAGCRTAHEHGSVVIMQPHEGDYLWLSPANKDKLGSGGEIQIYMDAETHPQAKASFAKFTLGVGGSLPEHRHDRTEEFSYILSGQGVVVVIDEQGAEKEIPVGPGYVWYNPPGAWHSIKNTGTTPLAMVFVVVPNHEHGLLSFFRKACAAPGRQGVALSPEQLEKIAAEHDLIFRATDAHDN